LQSQYFKPFILFSSQTYFLTHTHLHDAKYLCVADNARDSVFRYVSASSERQGSENEGGLMKKRTKRLTLKFSHGYGKEFLTILLNIVSE